MHDYVQIGMGREARRGYHLTEVSVVPTRRTRDVVDVSTAWRLDAFRFGIPLVAHASDAIMTPTTAALVGEAGGLGTLNAEGLWTRYSDPTPIYDKLSGARVDEATALLQQAYAEPIKTELITERVQQMRSAGSPVAMRVSPQHTAQLSAVILGAGVDLLIIQGTIVSAEHVSKAGDELNLKQFIAELDVPVIVGGCSNYQTALHLMRTGAAGIIVGFGADSSATSAEVLGIRAPMATAIVDAAAARRDYLDETGGRYVHVVADGELRNSGDIVTALGCGADAVMLGRALATATQSPVDNAWWDYSASHPALPRGKFVADPAICAVPMTQLLEGPAVVPDGSQNLFGGLRRAMAKCGFSDLKEFQRVELGLSDASNLLA